MEKQQPSEPNFDGMNSVLCPDACTEPRCEITCAGYCAHPLKGPLHQAESLKPEIVVRYQKARAFLEGQKAEKKIARMS